MFCTSQDSIQIGGQKQCGITLIAEISTTSSISMPKLLTKYGMATSSVGTRYRLVHTWNGFLQTQTISSRHIHLTRRLDKASSWATGKNLVEYGEATILLSMLKELNVQDPSRRFVSFELVTLYHRRLQLFQLLMAQYPSHATHSMVIENVRR